MADDIAAAAQITFMQGESSLLENEDLSSAIEKIEAKVADLSNVKNLHFLLGAGTSADCIPPMKTLLELISSHVSSEDFETNNQAKLSAEDIANARDKFSAVCQGAGENLEQALGTLYAHRAYLEGLGQVDAINDLLIDTIESCIYREVNIDVISTQAEKSLNLYKKFYQKLALRNKDLARVNVFTTNNDLLSETALDYLNINYNNGFGGGLNSTFNPARFSYTYSKKIDDSIEKYQPIENMVYLYKLHGSVSWKECEDNSFFSVKEVAVSPGGKSSGDNVLIYPTPLKQNKSLGSPYSDLIREFQRKILLPNSVLFVIGYSFSDEHINNIIYQALASNSSISIVVFGNHPDENLFKVLDRRIYKIFSNNEEVGDMKNIHFFDYIVNKLLPDLDENIDSKLLKDFVGQMKELSSGKSSQ